jgi:hypothetical protein
LTQLYEPIAGEFHDVSVKALTAISERIFKDLKETLEKLFQKEWYVPSHMK